MKELLVLLEDELHAREVNLEILTGICAGLHKPTGRPLPTRCCSWSPPWQPRWNATSSRNAPSTASPPRQPKADGRPPVAVDGDTLAVARARQARGESITAIARHLKIGRSTLYRALTPNTAD